MQWSFFFRGRSKHVFHRFEMDFYHLFIIFGVSNLLYSQVQIVLKLSMYWGGLADLWQACSKLQNLNQHFRSRFTTPHLEKLETNFSKCCAIWSYLLMVQMEENKNENAPGPCLAVLFHSAFSFWITSLFTINKYNCFAFVINKPIPISVHIRYLSLYKKTDIT